MPSTPPFPLVLGLVLLVPGFVGFAHAQGSPRSVSDCERLKNDLAYNQCLSMFGPAAKNVAGGDDGTTGTAVAPALPSAAAAVPLAEEPAPEARRGRRYRRGSYTRGGRQSASFTTGGETRPYRRYRRRRH